MGEAKALLPFKEHTFLDEIIRKLRLVFDQLFLVVKSSSDFPRSPIPAIEDLYPQRGSLVGLLTALKQSPADWTFVTTCDAPFPNIDLIRYMERQRDKVEAVIPVFNRQPVPLFAFYKKTSIIPAERQFGVGNFRLRDLIPRLNARLVGEGEIAAFDPDFKSFINVNTKEEYRQLTGVL